MKQTIKHLLGLGIFALIFSSCNKQDLNPIIYVSLNKEIQLIRDVDELQLSNDEYSNHAYGIISGQINEQFISTGKKYFDLNSDSDKDIGFEIIDLHEYNPADIPESLDTLAARVLCEGIEILDSSTFGYCDALPFDQIIDMDGNWESRTFVLGTFAGAGRFNGQGEKYLAFRFIDDNIAPTYGWVKLELSQHNDVLSIYEYAYSSTPGVPIKMGQIE